jgi:hypothetical protein
MKDVATSAKKILAPQLQDNPILMHEKLTRSDFTSNAENG